MGVSPSILMFGREAKPASVVTEVGFQPGSYQAHLQSTLARLHDFVDTNQAAAAQSQKMHYDKNTRARLFRVGDPVWLSIPTARKLTRGMAHCGGEKSCYHGDC